MRRKAELTVEQMEERAFESPYIKSECGVFVENRSGEQNITLAANGAVP